MDKKSGRYLPSHIGCSKFIFLSNFSRLHKLLNLLNYGCEKSQFSCHEMSVVDISGETHQLSVIDHFK